MSPKPNVDRVAAEYEQESRWYFNCQSSARSPDAQVNELIGVVETIFDCAQPVLRLQSCEIVALEYDCDIDLGERYEHEHAGRHSSRITSSQKEGLSVEEVRSTVRSLVSSLNLAVITKIEFSNVETYITLEDTKRYICKEDRDRYQRFYDDDWLDRPVESDPITATLTHAVLPSHSDIDTNLAHRLKLRTQTGIWFGEDDIAAANRERLADVIQCLHTELGTGSRYFGGEYWGEHGLAEAPNLGCLVPWMDER